MSLAMVYKEVYGSNVLRFDEVVSTNEVANSMLKNQEIRPGVIIRTDFQKEGKGQDKNSWESDAKRNLLLSLIINSDYLPPEKQFYLNKIVSLAVSDLLNELFPKRDICIKWPNDIYVGDKKIAGILINNTIKGSSLEHSVLGIGLNVNQRKFVSDAPNPTSIAILKRKEFDLEKCFIRLCDQLNFRCHQLQQFDYDAIDKDYLSRLYRYKKFANYWIDNKKVNARIIGLDQYGKLCLKDKKTNDYCCDLKEVTFII